MAYKMEIAKEQTKVLVCKNIGGGLPNRYHSVENIGFSSA